jgi:hypothetical protein
MNTDASDDKLLVSESGNDGEREAKAEKMSDGALASPSKVLALASSSADQHQTASELLRCLYSEYDRMRLNQATLVRLLQAHSIDMDQTERQPQITPQRVVDIQKHLGIVSPLQPSDISRLPLATLHDQPVGSYLSLPAISSFSEPSSSDSASSVVFPLSAQPPHSLSHETSRPDMSLTRGDALSKVSEAILCASPEPVASIHIRRRPLRCQRPSA